VAPAAPVAPAAAAAKAKTPAPKAKNGGGAPAKAPVDSSDSEGEEHEEDEEMEEQDDLVSGAFPAIGDLQDPARWPEFDPADVLLALRSRYTTTGARDYPESVVEDMLLALQALLRDAPPAKVAQVLVDHLEQVAAYREGASADALRKFRSRVRGEEMNSRYKSAWKGLGKADGKSTANRDGYRRPTSAHTDGVRRKPWASTGTQQGGGGKTLFVPAGQYAKLSEEERTALKRMRNKLRE
jgi:hypothetical protein